MPYDLRQLAYSDTDLFEPVTIQSKRGLATGILTTNNRGCPTDLTYDPVTGLLSVTRRARFKGPVSVQSLLTLGRVQAQSKLVRIGVDEENGQVLLQGTSLCPNPELAGHVFHRVLIDLRQMLGDDRLKAVLEN